MSLRADILRGGSEGVKKDLVVEARRVETQKSINPSKRLTSSIDQLTRVNKKVNKTKQYIPRSRNIFFETNKTMPFKYWFEDNSQKIKVGLTSIAVIMGSYLVVDKFNEYIKSEPVTVTNKYLNGVSEYLDIEKKDPELISKEYVGESEMLRQEEKLVAQSNLSKKQGVNNNWVTHVKPAKKKRIIRTVEDLYPGY